METVTINSDNKVRNWKKAPNSWKNLTTKESNPNNDALNWPAS